MVNINFYLLSHFQNFCDTFRTFGMFGMQKDDKITFLLEVSQNKVICKKAVSKGCWCKESSLLSTHEQEKPRSVFLQKG